MSTVDRGIDRTKGFGDNYRISLMDRVGMALSKWQIRRHVGTFAGKRIGDVGCGHEARFIRQILGEPSHVVLVDISLADDLKANPSITPYEGPLPQVLEKVPDASLDIVVCNNVLEHLWQPRATVEHIRRTLAPGGVAFLNVPSWRGKTILESAAFRLNWTSKAEIDDHKHYYSPMDLWGLAVESGFKPSLIKCDAHKFGLNVYAACRVPD